MKMQNKIPFELSDYVLKKYFEDTGKRQGWLFNSEELGIRNEEENKKTLLTPNSSPLTAVLAVSGGGDSVALLWLFQKFYKGKIFVIHVNHGIRGQESDEDEKFVANLAEKFGVEFISKKINVPEQKLKGESIEAAARRLRREAICGIVKTKILNNPSIFLGHNRDDLAETVLFNILRGSGIRGSVGMTEMTEYKGLKFYKPLLGLRREFLREILRVRDVSWREDSTNNDENYTRNFIRKNLLPLINIKINSSSIEHLAAFGEDMRKIRTIEDERSRELLERCKESESQNLILNRKILRNFSNDERALIIREIGRNLELKTLSRRRCEELADLIAKPSSFIFQWQDNINVKSWNSKIIFERE